MRYLLNCQQHGHISLLQQVENLYSFTSDSFPAVQFCNFCNQLAEQVRSHHLQLEVIQMKLIDKLKTAKQCVIRNSGLYGSDEMIMQRQKMEDWLNHQERIGVDTNNERKFLDVLHQFQTAVFESDTHEQNIPLVFLTKYMGGGTVPLHVTNHSVEDNKSIDITDTIIKEEFSDHDYDDEPLEPQGFLDDVLDPQLQCKNENMAEIPGPIMVTSRKGRRKTKKKTIVRKVKTVNQKKVSKISQLSSSTPVRKSSCRIAATAANMRFKELRKARPGEQVTKKIVEKAKVSSSKSKSKPVPTEAQKLAKEIRQKKLAKAKSMKNYNPRLWTCEECSFTTTTSSRMEQHLRKHEGTEDERNYECPDCKMKFKRKQYFEHHVTLYCGQINWYCDACVKWIPRQKLKEHVDELHSGQLYPCKYCGHQYVSYTSYSPFYHIAEGRKHDCLECQEPKTFKSKARLHRHLYEQHGHDEFVFNCSYENCSVTFYLESSLRAHVVRSHEQTIKCEACDKPFPSKGSLEQHIRIVHKCEKLFSCEQCQEKFSYKHTLEIHMMNSHNMPKLRCDVCQKEYVQAEPLKQHMFREHGIGDIEYHHCKLCDKKFTSRKNLHRHMQYHTAGFNHTCHVCGLRLKKNLTKASHVKTCDGRGEMSCLPYICEHCGAAFNQRGSLNIHKKKHLQNDGGNLFRSDTSREAMTDGTDIPLV
ncbi:putative zinc finger protein [Orchesella cincta]|uniref:Putative zinc finger protein n=1 Tax=Orchesella cincta TaxID=48709 RepID=A0A1D2MY53_ORCCI|nr:putative zinc finger protein [Orchesella cincta]